MSNTNATKQQWVHCPSCNGKTRTKLRADTVLENFPLFCPKCKKEAIIDAHDGIVTVRCTI